MSIRSVEEGTGRFPLVSIVMSVFNGERFLRESIDSLLMQTYKNLEIVLVNDGSQDRSRDIVETYNDERIVYIDRSENRGLTKSLNEGLQRVRGEYVARLDVGDIALSSRIEEQVIFLQQHAEIGILGTGIALFSNKGRTLREYVYGSDHEAIRKQLLQFTNPLPHSSLMFRRWVLERLNGYCPAFVRSQDYDLLLRALSITKLASIPRVLVRLRFDPSSLSYGSTAQLVYGIAALVCARHRQHDHRDASKWEVSNQLLRSVEGFIYRHRIDSKMEAAKYRLLVRVALMERCWVDCLLHAMRLIRHPFFSVYTRARMSAFIANHLEEIVLHEHVCRD